MPRVILWDLMDTLVRDPFFTHVPAFFGLSFEQLIEHKHPNAWGEFELGRIDERELFARFFADRRSIDGPALKRHMIEHCNFIAGIEPLLAELSRAGIEMHLLSNYSEWFREYVQRLRIDRYVMPTFVSCKTGVRKPHPEAYRLPCRSLGIEPGEALFVDDREINCKSAAEQGLDVYRFDGDVRALREALLSRGLLPAAPTSA